MINYEINITDQNDDRIDDSTFMYLPMLKVPDISADMLTYGSMNNNDHDLMEGSIVTKEYGVTKQVHRSGARHWSSFGGYNARILHTDDFLVDNTDANNSRMINNCLSILYIVGQVSRTSITGRNEKKMHHTNASVGSKNPTIVNVPTNDDNKWWIDYGWKFKSNWKCNYNKRAQRYCTAL